MKKFTVYANYTNGRKVVETFATMKEVEYFAFFLHCFAREIIYTYTNENGEFCKRYFSR